MKILYVGDSSKNGYSLYQYSILKKNFKETKLIDFKKINFFFSLINRLSWHINFSIFDHIIHFYLKNKIHENYDLTYIHNEHVLGFKSINFLKKISKKTIFYCPDNPFKLRDNQRWYLLKPNLKLFDLIIFMQKNRLKYAKKNKLNNIVWIHPTFKIQEHERKKVNFKNRKYKIDVLIIGTWFPERGKLFLKLIENKINVVVYGAKWKKFKFYRKYKKFINKQINNDNLYRDTIYSSKITLCLPSIENDDDITNKSLEIPHIGSLLLAKKTRTHSQLFRDNIDAIFFNDTNDCLLKIKYLLNNQEKILKISKAGYFKIRKIKNNISYEANIKNILKNLSNKKNFFI